MSSPVDYPTLEPSSSSEPNTATEHRRGASTDERTPSEWIPVETDIGDPRDVTELVVRIHIDAPYRLPSGPNHQVETLPYDLFQIRVRAAAGAAVTDDERAESLAVDASIDANEAIRAAAASIVAGATDDGDRVARLVSWVYENITYEHTDDELASNVLATGVGDCSEKSLLFIALARAAGVPARRIVGLAFTYADREPAFGYHAWAEVELDGHWVPVDPTWNQVVADATHIRLAEGDSDQWHAAAGKIELWVSDFERAGPDRDIDPAQVAAELPTHLQLRR